ncbi:hypothetical protein DdX_16624 [Ditylenchus destructor]|uniref:Uncharacterized protein n=1 Tax=Ditylenchus destructor TaxID=166010 RepID=A0AAD4MQ14_9BILA|nr:hypothetical protein DdX_16624 [Ditylenchus destructor]
MELCLGFITASQNCWPKALTARNTANPTPEQTTPLSPASPTTLRFRSHTHRRKHLPNHFRKTIVPSGLVKPKWTAKKVTVTTERPEIQRTTKLPRNNYTAISYTYLTLILPHIHYEPYDKTTTGLARHLRWRASPVVGRGAPDLPPWNVRELRT